jgi:hypothetical protein
MTWPTCSSSRSSSTTRSAAARPPAESKALNPQLQNFEAWLVGAGAQIKVAPKAL